MALTRPAAWLLSGLVLLVMAGCGGPAATPPAAVERWATDAAVGANATINAVLTPPAATVAATAAPDVPPSATPLPSATLEPLATATAPPSITPIPSDTQAPTATDTPTDTPVPPPTATLPPTATPAPTETPAPNSGATQTAQAQQVASAVAATLAAQTTALAQEQAIAAAIAATLTAQATPTPRPTSTLRPTPTRAAAAAALLAYAYGNVGNADIHVYDPAGARTWAVADRACDEAEPDWMPDGRSVVYQADCDGRYDLYLADMTTRAIRRLTATNDRDEREPDVSADGMWLAYRVNRESNARNVDGELWVLNLGGGDPQPLGVSGRSPSWSPDGSRLAFMSERESNWEVYVYSLADRTTRRLTHCSPNCRFPAWSPDGQWIVYHTTTGADTADAETIWRIPASGGEAALLVTGSGAGRPTWSGEGWIAFNSQEGIEMVDEHGQGRRTLLASNSHWAPVWSR